MKKTGSLFGVIFLVSLVAIGAGVVYLYGGRGQTQEHVFPTTKYGAFLAAQHAVYVNDFDSANRYIAELGDVDYKTVRGMRYLSEFLGGKMPADAKELEKEKSAAAGVVYDAYLVTGDKWGELYARHKADKSALSAPLRIWSSVATGHVDDALKFVDGLSTNDSWKNFVRGQIYAETGDVARAAKAFGLVHTDFMNISDYLYIMSFYRHNNFDNAAQTLRTEFTSRPAGMFMLQYTDIPDWSLYSGHRNALGFSLVQNVSHTQAMMFSDLALLWLRFAQIVSPGYGQMGDAVNYYLGQYMFLNNSDCEKYFSAVGNNSPFYLFAKLRRVERNQNMRDLTNLAKENPVFVPALEMLTSKYVKTGDKGDALRVVNRALGVSDLPRAGRAYFLAMRARIFYTFGDLDKAQSDIHEASVLFPTDADIVSLQAKIWAAQNRELENAYSYAMALVRDNPVDVMAWETLGRVMAIRDGDDDAIGVLARVADVANSCSSLFEFLGDLYVRTDNAKMARDAYLRAISLADDGLTIVPNVEKKLRNLK